MVNLIGPYYFLGSTLFTRLFLAGRCTWAGYKTRDAQYRILEECLLYFLFDPITARYVYITNRPILPLRSALELQYHIIPWERDTQMGVRSDLYHIETVKL